MADVVQERSRAKVFHIARIDACPAAHRVRDGDDATGVALRDRVAMVDRMSDGHHDLGSRLGEHCDKVSVCQLQLGDQLRKGARSVLAFTFGEVQRLVRGSDQLGRGESIFRIRCDADTERQVVARRGRDRRRVDRVDDSVSQALRRSTIRVVHDDG